MSSKMPSGEQSKSEQGKLVAIGLALFSMYFGSGNVIFPVIVGYNTGHHAWLGIFGLLLTAVIIPYIGLYSMSLYKGDYMAFVGRLGKIPGWVIVTLIMALIGPLAIIPRCITVSYSALETFNPNIPRILFSLVFSIFLYAFTYKRARIIEILGKYLTPVLLFALAIIIVKGVFFSDETLDESPFTGSQAFVFGLLEGYNTMDLFASIVFSNVALANISRFFPGIENNRKKFLVTYLKTSAIGIGLLAVVYGGMCFASGFHSQALATTSPDKLFSTLAFHLLGPYSGIIVCVAVSFACLTTAIAVSLVFTEFMTQVLTHDKLSYRCTLFVVVLISFILSTL
jgi:LIVCS family branched-chain amino acid:cation transporter